MVKKYFNGLSFERAEQMLNTLPWKRLPGTATYLERINPDVIAVTYHDHVIVRINRDGRYMLDSCGYRTATTKRKIVDYSGAPLYQKDGAWYVGTDEFYDGIVYHPTAQLST
jgi:hypothetical protein